MKSQKCSHKSRRCRPRNKNAVLLIAGVILCALHWPIAGAALIIYGIFRSVSSADKPQPLSPYRRDIVKDAEIRGLTIPNDTDLWQMLRRLYRRHHSSCASFPNLQPEFDRIIEEVWNSLALTDDVIQWKLTVQEASRDWPVASAGASSRLKDAIQKAKQATQDWQEAHNEAWRAES